MSLLGRLARSKVVAQSLLFAGSNAFVALATAVAMALLARNLSTDAFGSFSFATAYLLFVALFFDFGMVLPAARMTAATEGRERREIIGATLLLYAPIGVAFCGVVAASSAIVDGAFNVTAGEAIALTAPLALVYPFQLLAWHLGQGTGRLHVYSITLAVGQVLFVAALAAALALGADASVTLGLLTRGAAMLVGWIVLVAWLRPIVRGARRHLRPLWLQVREYGLKVYYGRVLSTGTYNMDVLMVGALTDARSVGLYALAAALARGINLPLLGASSALFRRMSGERRLDRRWLTVAWAVGAACAVVLVAAGRPIVEVVFSSRYVDAAAILLPLAIGEVFRGMAMFYNTFLSAHAFGRELRNAGIVLTAANLVLNVALIPPFGIHGAAWASLGALLANFAAHVWYYRRAVAQLEARSEPPSAVLATS